MSTCHLLGLPVAVAAKIEVTSADECWPWRGAIGSHGYGNLRYQKRYWNSHKFVYVQLVGEVPEGLELDHVCHTLDKTCPGGIDCLHRRCVNPAHLEPVTPLENSHRGNAGLKERLKTHCPKGHPYDAANTILRPRGHRGCRSCQRVATCEAMRRRRAK